MRSVKNTNTPFNSLFDGTFSGRVPVACTFELTKKCNLKCLHCYIDRKSSARNELSTSEVRNILRQLAAAGTLYLVFTGGEIFTRKDIYKLCRFARELKFDLRLFTNGTLIDDKTAREIAGIGVSAVEISLYGRKHTHENITGVSGSYEKTVSAVRSLVKHGVRAVIKAPLTNLNYGDYGWLKKTAKKLKARLQADPLVTPKNSGDKSTLKYRLPGRELARIYASGDSAKSIRGTRDNSSLFCSAGRNLAAIDSAGTVYPCLQLRVPSGNLKEHSFCSIWNKKNKRISGILNIKNGDLKECSSCSLAPYCQRCPGLALLEDGSIIGASNIACKIAQIRKNLSIHM